MEEGKAEAEAKGGEGGVMSPTSEAGSSVGITEVMGGIEGLGAESPMLENIRAHAVGEARLREIQDELKRGRKKVTGFAREKSVNKGKLGRGSLTGGRSWR